MIKSFIEDLYMIEVSKQKYKEDEYEEISFIDGNKSMKMLFGGTGDLYFCASDCLNNDNKIVFNITKENFYLYSLFDEAYFRIKEPLVFIVNECELLFCKNYGDVSRLYESKKQRNEYLKNTSSYNMLYNKCTGVVSWHDDESIYEEGNILNIYPEEDKYVLEFVPGKNKDTFDMISVRFRNSGSTYAPFNSVFMDLFKKAQDYDASFHQIHIEEYLYSQKIKTYTKE